jgi:threonine dehydrogenase-like Zn-dependent dehydrogenase
MMRAFAMTEARPGGARLIDVPEPVLGPGDVRVEVRSVGICGTDIGVLDWGNGLASRTGLLPRIMGHEGAGVIIEIGSDVVGVAVGDVAAPISVYWCGECAFCVTDQSSICKNRTTIGIEWDGVLAQQAVFPADRVSVLPSRIPFDVAALSDPLATVLQAMARVPIAEGTTVAIVGSGTIGLMTALVARAYNPSRVILVGLSSDRDRLRLAEELGIETIESDDSAAVDKAIASMTNGEGVDVAFETAGHPDATLTSLRILRRGGRLGLVGLGHTPTPLMTEQVVWAEQILIGVRGYSVTAWAEAQRMIKEGAVDLTPLITHHLDLNEAPRAMELLRNREALKVMIHPNN